MEKGKVIFLNGATSSGKTTIAKAIQKTADENYYHLSNDLFYDIEEQMYNPRFYTDTETYMAEAVVLMYHFAKVLVEQGTNVIIDGMFHEDEGYLIKYGKTNYDSLLDILAGVNLFMVEVFCPLDECRRRNIARGDRREEHSKQQHEIMNRTVKYDFFVDTSIDSAQTCTDKILKAFQR